MANGAELTVTLAEKVGVGKVTVCACGVISLHLGGVTLRIPAKMLHQLEQLLEAAVDQMCELTAGITEPVTILQ